MGRVGLGLSIGPLDLQRKVGGERDVEHEVDIGLGLFIEVDGAPTGSPWTWSPRPPESSPRRSRGGVC